MATQKQLIEQLIREIEVIKTKMPNGELKVIQKSLQDLEKGQADVRQDIRAIQKRLFNPDNGLVVETNKNTFHRESRERYEVKEGQESEDLKYLIRWKGSVAKGLWVIYSAIIGILIKILLFKG